LCGAPSPVQGPALRCVALMGEARRRRQAGTYPSEPIEAARRFWCGRAPVTAEEFRAPIGTVAITFDIGGVDPSTAMIDAGAVGPLLPRLQAAVKGQSYYALVRLVAREFAKARRTDDDDAITWISLLGLWTALNHPRAGEQMRKAVSNSIRQDKTAHITWRFGPEGLGLALAGCFVDLGELARLAPADRIAVYAAPGAAPGEPEVSH
jgi:hypothetical protein